MSKQTCSTTVKRMLWRFNVEVIAYAHPLWLKSWPARASKKLHSQTLITQLELGLVDTAWMTSRRERLMLLDAYDLKKLARLGAALGVAERLKLSIRGKEVRACVRVLGRETVDMALQLESHILAQQFKRLTGTDSITSLPRHLLDIQRRLLRTLCDSVPSAAAQRMRLRFRPGYFDRVGVFGNDAALAAALLDAVPYANLSEQAKCILHY
ncbi:SctK family type III secretion system sorting platform protein [Collimonas sp. H4R21]|uniref:SctK family type III secretion system sorting platform protein n=1 Tax=Collimonas rhizosphaerae TaxID=3126357 RepID=A0ABU9PYM3_9BURK